MNDYDLWFELLKIPNSEKIQLLQKFNTADDIWYYFINSDRNPDTISKEEIENIKREIYKNDIKVVRYIDELYPINLKQCEDAPYMLFYKGNLQKLNENTSISVVGSRNNTSYGMNVTNIICKSLAENSINVVSGLAKGIDAIAHKSTLENGGFTCGVLGCGIDIIYPRENAKLYKDLAETGCIVTEFLPGTKPLSQNFPIRNRIISGLSSMVIVIEATVNSGSLITVKTALKQNRNVMAVPGSIFSDQSKGTNQLIRDGVPPVLDIDDIGVGIGLNLNIKKQSHIVKSNKTSEGKLYEIIGNNPIHIDDIIRMSNIDIKRVYELLFEMQFNNEILCLSGNYYVRVNDCI